jgi:pilus assembly protein TadC
VTALVVGVLVAAALLLAGRPRRLPAAPGRPDTLATGGDARERAGVEPEPALLLDLCAAALSAGMPVALALQVAGQAAGGDLGRRCDLVGATLLLGADHDSAWTGAPTELDSVRRGLQLVSAAGVPGADLLRGAAVAERARERLQAEALAQALGVRMVPPLGLCALPAFAAWGVVPVVLSLAAELL